MVRQSSLIWSSSSISFKMAHSICHLCAWRIFGIVSCAATQIAKEIMRYCKCFYGLCDLMMYLHKMQLCVYATCLHIFSEISWLSHLLIIAMNTRAVENIVSLFDCLMCRDANCEGDYEVSSMFLWPTRPHTKYAAMCIRYLPLYFQWNILAITSLNHNNEYSGCCI